MGRSRPSCSFCLRAVALSLLQCLSMVHALRRSERSELELQNSTRTYLFHKACGTADGLGGHVIKVRMFIAIALHHHWTFVCNPKDWDTHLHNTDNMGYLFGCKSESEVTGNLASYDSVQNLKWAPLGTQKLQRAGESIVYTSKDCKSMPPWGESWSWFRQQFHLVRGLDRERSQPRCWPPEGGRRNVVLALRKGDDPSRSKRAHVYLALLGAIFGGQLPNLTHITRDNAHVVVISETTEANADIQRLNQSFTADGLPSTFLLGAPERDTDAARARLVRDLDCMTQSDVLVLSTSGLSDLAAACQLPPGVALILDSNSRRGDGVPNVQKVKVHRTAEGTIETWKSELPNAMHVRVDVPGIRDSTGCPSCSHSHVG